MIIFINGQKYTLDTSVMTALRYRIAYGRSYLEMFGGDSDYTSHIEKMTKLIYIAIKGEKPYMYEIVEEFYKTGEDFVRTFELFCEALLHKNSSGTEPEPQPAQESDEEKKINEYELFCVYIAMGLPYEFLKELPLFEFVKIVSAMDRVKNGRREEITRLDATGREKLYSITDEDKEKIKAYINAKKEG